MIPDFTEKISIILPVFNEESAVEEVLTDILKNYKNSEVIVIDDGSTDSTKERLSKFNIKILTHKNNRGYGAALKTGIRNAVNDIIVTIDADGEHSAKDIDLLISNFDSFDMLVGKRIINIENKLWKKTGKFILCKIANLAAGLAIPDINSGLRVFRKSAILNYLDILPDSFSFHTTSTLLFIFNSYKIKYIPVKVYPRKGNSKVTLQSGINSLKKIMVISSIFKPARALVLVLYLLSVALSLTLFIFFLISGKSLLPLSFALLFIILFILPLDILSRSKKDLILDVN